MPSTVVVPHAPAVTAPTAIAGQPATVLTPVAVPTAHQFHAQDELGQYQFGYIEPNSNRIETKTADGVVTGNYNYIDSDGIVQTVHYIADALGFRVAGTNLPHAAPVAPVAPPLPVTDTAEVIAAREAHLRLVEDNRAAVESARSAEPDVSAKNAEPKRIITIEDYIVEENNELVPEYDDELVEISETPVERLSGFKPADPEKVNAALAKHFKEEEGSGDSSAENVNFIHDGITYTVGGAVYGGNTFNNYVRSMPHAIHRGTGIIAEVAKGLTFVKSDLYIQPF